MSDFLVSDFLKLDSLSLFAILAMGVTTYFTRILGFVLVRHIRFSGRARVAMEALPPAVLMAVIAPAVFMQGPAELVAGAVTVFAAFRLPLLGVIAVGVISIYVLRLAFGVWL